MRGCSGPLQRRIVDFASSDTFQEAEAKLAEHYGIEIGRETIRKITLRHARKAGQFLEEHVPQASPARKIVSELDGSMVPVVTFHTTSECADKRKSRTVGWREARLCLSRSVDSATPTFRATMGSPEVAGDYWYTTAKAAGMGDNTVVHCVGDGALWIKDQADRVFSSQGSYLIDFYHVSEYLGEVSREGNFSNRQHWLREQQGRLKEGNLYLVLQELERLLYTEGEAPMKAVEACYRYITNRLFQFDYLGALEDELPIGSGEIESSHRKVIQKRLKKPGSWWDLDNVEAMLQLMTLRANNLWACYWTASSIPECEAA